MAMMCAVSFTRYGRLYYYAPGPITPRVGDKVLVPTTAGPEVAECIWAPQWVDTYEDAGIGGLEELVGFATPDDLARDERSRERRARARVVAKRQIREQGLPMKVVGVDWVEAEKQITIYFSAPQYVDFRELVRTLARELDARIELRQLGARDEARIQGGIGPCGRDTCCSTFLKDFEPVSVRMAKDQDLPVNPLKISGACGRLMCCLKYEHPLYVDTKANAPARGEKVMTPEGPGRVVGLNVPSETVKVRLDETGRTCSCSLASVCGSRQEYESSRKDGSMRWDPE
jgi:cell fate regulator YaaT (PSP1 superfamily)